MIRGTRLLKLKTIVVDRTRSPFLKEGESFYLKRLQRYVRMEWIEVKPAKIKKGRSDKEILATESRSIDLKLAPEGYLVPLHSTGHPFNSEELAGWLDGLSARTGGVGYLCHRRPLGTLPGPSGSRSKNPVPISPDLDPQDGPPCAFGATLQGFYHIAWGKIS